MVILSVLLAALSLAASPPAVAGPSARDIIIEVPPGSKGLLESDETRIDALTEQSGLSDGRR